MDELSGIVSGLFGLNPMQVQQQQQANIDAQANTYANQNPYQRATSSMYKAGAGLASVGGGMLGMVNPQMEQARKEQTYLQGVNLEDPASIRARANQIVDPQYKLKLGILANAVEKRLAELNVLKAREKYFLGEGKSGKNSFTEKDNDASVFGKAQVRANNVYMNETRYHNATHDEAMQSANKAAQEVINQWNEYKQTKGLGDKKTTETKVATQLPQTVTPQSPAPVTMDSMIESSAKRIAKFDATPTPSQISSVAKQQGFTLDPIPRNRVESDTDQAMTYAIPDYPSVESTPLPAEQPSVPLPTPVTPVVIPAPAPVVTAPAPAPVQVEQVLTPKKKAELIRDAIRRGATQDAEDIRKLPTGKPKTENASGYGNRPSDTAYKKQYAEEMAKTDPVLASREAEAKKTGEDAAAFNAKQYEQVLESKRSLDNVANLKKELASSDAITGIGADIRKNIARVRAFFGSKYAGKVVTDTELLNAMTGAETYPLMKALGITSQMMNTPNERDFIREVFLGNISLNKDTLLRLADIREKAAQKTIDDWNSRVKGGELDNFFKLSGKRKEIIAPAVESKRSKKWNPKSGKWE